MKERHREWAKLSAVRRRKPAEPVERREVLVRDLKGIEAFDRSCFLRANRRGELPAELDDAARDLSLAIFGLSVAEPAYVYPDAYYECDEDTPEAWAFERARDAFEARFTIAKLPDDEKVQALLDLGWDFRTAQGEPLSCLRLFLRQAEAVGRGIAGRWPDIEVSRAAKTEARLAEEARVWAQSRRQKPRH
jgi:hypothetical protein